jgi:creatinine amidohydrolase
MLRLFAALAAVVAALFSAIPNPVEPDPATPRPIDAVDSVWIEDLTWMEIRDRMRAGVDTVIIPTGGVEQNGPYLVTGKHNYVLKGLMDPLARKLGNALVAPIVGFVPEGGIDPPSLHMKYPGTVSVSEATFQSLLSDICASMKQHGFKRIILLGDSGGNQPGMKAVAEKLSTQWGGTPRIDYVPECYDYPGATKWVESQGIKQTPEGLHDDFVMTAQLLAIDPQTVRMNERIKAGKFSINGVDLAPAEKSIEWGKKIIDFRVNQMVAAIQGKK